MASARPSARLSASRPADSRTPNHPNVAPHTLAPCHGVWCARAPSASLSCSLSLRLVHGTQTAQNDSAHVRISRGTKRTVYNHNNKWLHGLTDEELVCARAMQCPGTQKEWVPIRTGPSTFEPVHAASAQLLSRNNECSPTAGPLGKRCVTGAARASPQPWGWQTSSPQTSASTQPCSPESSQPHLR